MKTQDGPWSLVTHAERPDLLDGVDSLETDAFPEFMLHDPHWPAVAELAFGLLPDWQVYILSPQGQLVGLINTITLSWTGEIADLPTSYHGAVADASALHHAGDSANTLMGVQAIIDRSASGQGLITQALGVVTDLARQRGLTHAIGSVRPTAKEAYPLIPMEDYLAWRAPDGRRFDPWFRVQESIGGDALAITREPMRFEYPVQRWREWTGLVLPFDGQYVVPGAIAPLIVIGDVGVLEEDNVWFSYPPV